MDNTENKVHKRRVRYSGTHPKHFHEKYKELNPEKYGEEIEKIKNKGHTPAGMHISIMVDEILDFLDIKPGQVGLESYTISAIGMLISCFSLIFFMHAAA